MYVVKGDGRQETLHFDKIIARFKKLKGLTSEDTSVEQLEREVAELRHALVDKQEQKNVMLQVLMRVEQEQRVTEDAHKFAEQDAAAQRYAAQVLQTLYNPCKLEISCKSQASGFLSTIKRLLRSEQGYL
ncbi:hypothetical protein CsSME_00032868 [Camellia sinensis var. sinensis]